MQHTYTHPHTSFGRSVVASPLVRRLTTLLPFLALLVLPRVGWGQVTIAQQDFETTPATPTAAVTTTNGAFFTTSSATGDRPASLPFYLGARAFGVSNGTANVASSSNIDVSGYTGVSLSVRLAAFSIASTGNGMDAGDSVIVAISTNGGTSYSNEVRVAGNSNAYWHYTTGSANASTAYDGDNAASSFAPGGGGARTTDGYSTITVTGLPSTSQLRFRIRLRNNDAAERWMVDNVVIQGTASGSPTVTPSVTTLPAFNTLAGTASTAQTYTVSGANLGTTDITVTTPTGYEVSKTNATTGFAGFQTISPSSGTVTNVPVWVRLTSSASGAPAGNVTHVSGTGSANVSVTGTVVAEPTTAPGISAGTPGSSTVTLTLSGGNGTRRLVVVRPAANGAVAPTDQTTYTANPAYGSGTTTGTNNYVVSAALNATTSVPVNNLAPSTSYVADVYAYNEGTAASFENYLPTPAGTVSFTTGTATCLSGGDFESATFPPTNWATSPAGSATRSTSAGDFKNGVAGAIMGLNSSSSTFTTPAITNPQSISFYLGVSSNGTAKQLKINVSTTSQSTGFTTIYTYGHNTTGDEVLVNGSYDLKTIDLSAYNASSSVWVQFEKNGLTTSPFRLDDVTAVCGVFGPSTTTGTISPASYCVAGTGAAISVPFTVTNGPFTGGNTFTAVLSDASGSFAVPANNTTLGTLSGTTSGTISGTIPNTVAAGTGYRVRVQASTPAANGVANGANLTVIQPPTSYSVALTGTTTQSFCATAGGTALGTSISGTTSTTAYTYTWKYGTTAGVYPNTIGGATSATYTPQGSDFSGPNTYFLIAEATSSCGSVVQQSNAATITVLPNVAAASVKQGATTYPSGGATYSFPATAWGSSSSAVTFTITNSGCATLNLGTLTTTGAFSVTQPVSTSVASGASTTFTATYTPTAVGSQSGTVQIPSNDPATPYVLNLGGTGQPSNLSDVITSASVTYNTTGIDYASKQGTSVSSANNALNEVVYRITVRDGGGVTDGDNLPTILDGLTINITQGAAAIRAAALFTTSNALAGQGVVAGSTITFSGLVASLGPNVSRVTAADNGSFDLILRVTFKQVVTDGQQLRFSVANASAVAEGSNVSSTFKTTGTASSTTTAGSNEIDVIATKLVYSPAPPTTAAVNTDINVGVVARDAFDNQDTDFRNGTVPTVTLTKSAGTGTFSSVLNPTLTKTLTGGQATWTDLRYDVVENGVGLTTTNTSTLANVTATIDFIAFAGHLWVGPSGGAWNVAANWSKGTVPTATDDVRLDNSSVSGSYSVNVNVNGAVARSLQVGYVVNSNTITLNINPDNGAGDMLTVGDGAATVSPDLLIAQGGVVNNNDAGAGLTNTGLRFASSSLDTWEMTSTGYFFQANRTGVPNIGAGKSTFAATSTVELQGLSAAGTPLQSWLTRVKKVGNFKLTNPSTTANFATASNGLADGDSLWVQGNMTVLTSVDVALNSTATKGVRLWVDGNLTIDGGVFAVAAASTDNFNRATVVGNVTTTNGGSFKATTSGTDKGRLFIGGTFTGIYNAGANTTTGFDELVFVGGTGVSTFNYASGTLRNVTVKKEMKLGASINPSTLTQVISGGTLDFNGSNVGGTGNGVFTLLAGGTLKITDPNGITSGTTATGNVRTSASNSRNFPNGATYWYTGSVAQITGTGLPTTNGTKSVIADNSTTVTLTANTSIQSPGRLEIKQGTFIETATAEISGTGNLTMTGGTYRMVKGVAAGVPPTLPQLTGTYTLTDGAIELAGSQNQALRGSTSYRRLRFANAGTKYLTSAVSNVPDTVTIKGAAILDVSQSATGVAGSVSLTGPGALRMLGSAKLRSALTTAVSPAPGMEGVYDLTGTSLIEFVNSTATIQTIRGNDVADPARTYNNIDVIGTNVGASSGNFAIRAGGTMTVKTGGSFSMTDQAITGAGSFVLESGSTFKYGATPGITLLATGGTGTSAGNIRVSGARTFATTANYVLQGVGNAATGDGLPATVASLTLAKSTAGNVVTLTSPVTVTNALTLTQGLLAIGNNDLTLNPTTGTLSGGSATVYIQTDPSASATGALVRQVPNTSTDVLFPIGTSDYTPVTLRQTAAGTATSFRARVFNGVLKEGTTGTTVTSHVVNRTWVVDRATPLATVNATLTVQWNAADETVPFNRPMARLSHYANGTYDFPIPAGAGVLTGGGPFTMSRSGLTSFSPFAVVDGNNVLPVELVRFTAVPTSAGNRLAWTTAQELNNDYFEVQRSLTAAFDVVTVLAKVAGHGTSAHVHDYAYLDAPAPATAVVYYRLRQVDLDGSAHLSGVVAVTRAKSLGELALYPNPATEQLTVELPAGATTLEVFDALGRQVLLADAADLAPLGQAGATQLLDLRALPVGTYRLRVSGPALAPLSRPFVKAGR